MSSVTKRYRIDGEAEYTMTFSPDPHRPGTYKIYCTDHPFCPYDMNPQKTHIYSDGSLCVVQGREPRSMDRAIAIGLLWIKGFNHYCRTGTFPNDGGRVNV